MANAIRLAMTIRSVCRPKVIYISPSTLVLFQNCEDRFSFYIVHKHRTVERNAVLIVIKFPLELALRHGHCLYLP